MKFLMYSEAGEGAQILKRIEQEGNEVGIYIKDKRYKTVWDGLLPKVTPEWDADVIIFDQSGNGDAADDYLNNGKSVYGGSSLCDELEKDRDFGLSVMDSCGIKTPDYYRCSNFKEAKDVVEGDSRLLVFKPSGHDLPTKLTFVPKDKEELLDYMDFVENKYSKQIDDIVLQEFIEGHIISTEAFCDGNKFVGPFNHTIEVKKAFNNDLGPSTGCSGNIVWLDESNKIIKAGIGRMERWCKENCFIGQLDLNTIVNEKGVYGLEWTPRFGYDATPTLMYMLNMDFGEFYYDMCNGKGSLDIIDTFAGAVRVAIPPYPAEFLGKKDSEESSPNSGIPIMNYEKFAEDMYMYEVMCKDGKLVHSSGTGVIGCAMGIGDHPEESLMHPYKMLETIHIPDKFYRTDLKKVLSKMYNEVIKYA